MIIIKKGIKGKNKGGILSILSICMSVLVLSLGSLYFATDKFGIEMFYSYFEYSNAIVHAFQRFRAPFSGKIVHIFPEQSAVI